MTTKLIGLFFVVFSLFGQVAGRSGTARSKTDLMYLFRDDQSLGNIKARAVRDLIESVPDLAGQESSTYAFSTSGSTSLTSGQSATFTFSSCPAGLYGTNSNHYIRIVDAVNGNENVLVTGGTCSASGGIGTITFTPSFSHTSYTLMSATAGIQEAVWANAPASAVKIPCGTHTIYAPIRIQTTATYTQRVPIYGEDRGCAIVKSASTFPVGIPGFLISDNGTPGEKYISGQYGISNLTLDFRLTPNSDILQVGTSTDLAVANGPLFHHLNFWGGARWIYAHTGGKLWVSDSYFIKDTNDTDGIYLDVTGAYLGGWSLADLEMGTDSQTEGNGIGIHIVCDAPVVCGYTLIDNINILGRWKSAVVAEDTVAHTGMYVVIDRLISEALTSDQPVVFRNSNFNQVRNSWISQFNPDSGKAAMLLDQANVILFTGNYFYTADATSAHVDIDSGGRHLWEGNQFISGLSPAFNFLSSAAESFAGFNQYAGPVHNNQDADWLQYTTTGSGINNTPPIVSPFEMRPFKIPVSESGGTKVLVLENSDEGSVLGRKWFTVDNSGALRILNHAGTDPLLYLNDNGALTLPVNEAGRSLILLNNEEGTTNGKKWITVSSNGSFDIINNAGTDVNFRVDDVGLMSTRGGASIGAGGSANKTICWKGDGKALGYCSSVVAADGSCTCN